MAIRTRTMLPLFALLTACIIVGGDDDGGEPLPEIPENPNGNFTLIVSNQSFDVDPVDIRVEIDGKLAVADQFEVGSQHTFVSYTFQLQPGSRTLRARSVAGDAELDTTIEVTPARRWGVLMYWYYPTTPEPTARQFSFSVHDEQPAFD